MADNTVAGFGKDPLAGSHGDALADQSFQSLKSKEIRDSLSPTEMRFQSVALNNPNTTGWNVQSSKEISPDGRGFRAETVATTDGVENINGGTAEFKGRNEQRSSAHQQGDDKNFVKKAMESSNSHLQEKVVFGDENSGRTEVRTSSTTSTSSSQVFQSSSTNYDDDYAQPHQAHPQKYLMDSNRPDQYDVQQRQHHDQQQPHQQDEQRHYEQQFEKQRQQHHNQQERRTTEQMATTRQNTEQRNTSQNVQTQETHEQNKRYVDMDKASPEYQQHVQYLMQQPGEIISNTVEYPKPNVKMITTVKRLPDGTIVRNKRYETEESTTPSTPIIRATSTPINQTQPRRDSQQPSNRNYQPERAPHSRPSQDMVDSSTNTRYVQETHKDDVEKTVSTVKKSSQKYSTETTSETIQEIEDRHPYGEPNSRPKQVTNDFSTQGFPSVRPNKPTQEYPNERPNTAQPQQAYYPSQSGPYSQPSEAVVPRYTDAAENITDRRIPTEDGELIIVSSEKKRNYKTSSNSESIVETEHVVRDDQPYQQIPDKSQDYSTHGFPSVREPTGQQPKNYQPRERQVQPHEQDFPLDKFSPGRRIVKTSSPHGDDDVIVVSSRNSKHNTNTERVIKHEIVRDDQPSGGPRSVQPNTDNTTYNYIVTTPSDQGPKGGFPATTSGKPSNADYHEPYGDYPTGGPNQSYPSGSPKTPVNDYSSAKSPSKPAAGLPSSHKRHPSSPSKSPSNDYTTQGFPSVRSPSKDTPTQGYPSSVDNRRPNGTAEQPRSVTPTTTTTKTQPITSSPNKYKTTSTTNNVRETTERVIRKEKEVDMAHRAFAASLRSSSPNDTVRRDSHTTDSHTRQTPRSSVSSTRTFRRDVREGSHDSAPSETSRISSTTITRNTPPRNVGGRTVVTKVTKSPSPGKTGTTTTTTTTRTMTSKDVPKSTEKSPTKKPQPAPSSRSSTPSYINSSKKPQPTTSVMTDDDDDIENSPLSPSSSHRSRTPQKIGPNDKKPKALPHDDWQKPAQPDDNDTDEPRTVNAQPIESRKPKPLQQPNVEWVIVDDNYDHDDDDSDSDSFAPEVVDSKMNVKKTTTKLITNERQVPLAPLRKPKSSTITTTTITTKQLHTLPSKTQTKPQDKSPLKTKPSSDSRAPQTHPRTQKSLSDTRSPARTPSKTPFKVGDHKPLPKSSVPSHTSPLRKPLPKTTEESTLRKTLKTAQVIKEKTNKLIEAEKPKRKPQTTPQGETKPQASVHKKPRNIEKETIIVTEITQKRGPQVKTLDNEEPYETNEQPLLGKSGYEHGSKKPLDTDETQPGYGKPVDPHYQQPQGIYEESHPEAPGYRYPQMTGEQPNQKYPAFRKPQDTFEEPNQHTAGYRKPQGTDDEPVQGFPTSKKPQSVEPNQCTPVLGKPHGTDDQPSRGSPVLRKPPSPGFMKLQGTFDERSPYYRKPQGDEGELHYLTPEQTFEQQITVTETTERLYPEKEAPQRPDRKPNQYNPGYNKPRGTDDEPHRDTSTFGKLKDYDNEPRYHTPGYGMPYDKESSQSSPGYRKPQDFKKEPDQHTLGHRKPSDIDDQPSEGSPSYKNPYDFETEPDQRTPGHRNPYDTDDQPSQGKPDYKKPQDFDTKPAQNTSEPHNRRPQSPERRPGQYAPGSQGRTPIPGHLKTDEEPGTPGYRKPQQKTLPKYIQKTGDKPEETDEDECFTATESTTRTSQKTVAKHIEKFETNYLKSKTPSKPPTGTKSPTKELPQSLRKQTKPPGKESSPTRPQKKPLPETKPVKPGSIKPIETNEDITFAENTEYIINTTQKRVTTERQTGEPKYPIKQPQTPTTRDNTPIDSQKKPEEPIAKGPKPLGIKNKPRKPLDTDNPEKVVETSEFLINSTNKYAVKEKQTVEFEEIYNQKTPRNDSPTRIHKKFEEPIERSQSPTKPVSPTRMQKKPEQKSPIAPTDRKPGTPDKHVSPTRTQKKPNGNIPVDEETYTTTLKTSKIVREVSPTARKPGQKSPQESTARRPQSPNKSISPTKSQTKPGETVPVDDIAFRKTLRTTENITEKQTVGKTPFKKGDKPEQKPKDGKQYPDQYSDTAVDETFTETCEFVTNTTEKRFVNEQQVLEIEDSRYPTSSTTRLSPTLVSKYPREQIPEELSKRRPQSPNKHVSPTRNQKKPSEEIPLVDETFTTSLTTTRVVKEKITKEFEDEDKTQGRKPMSGKPLLDEKPRAPIRPGQKLPHEQEFKGPTSGRPQFPIKRKSPTRSEKNPVDVDETYQTTLRKTTTVTTSKTDEKVPLKTGDKPAIRDASPTRYQKKPGRKESELTGRRPQSPARSQWKPINEDETLKTTLRTTKTVTTKTMDNEEYPEESLPIKYEKIKERKPMTEEPIKTEPTGKIPQSPTFNTTITVTTKTVSDQEYPYEETAYKTGDKPKGRKPHPNISIDTDEEETTTEHNVTSITRKVTEKLTKEFEEPESPKRGVSPTRTTKKPGQISPQEPDSKKPTGEKPKSSTRDLSPKKPSQKSPEDTDLKTPTSSGPHPLKEPSDKIPKSPIQTQKKPTTADDTFKTTLRTTKIVTTRTVDDKEYPHKKLPYKKGDKPEPKPKERKPHSDKPYNTDEDETITETREQDITSTSRIITEKLIEDFEQREASIRGVSPTRKPVQLPVEQALKEAIGKSPHSPTLKPGQKNPEEPLTKEATGKRPQSPTFKITKTVTTKTVDDDQYTDEKTPYKTTGDKPKDRKPFDTDEEKTFTEHIVTSTTRQVTEKWHPESPDRGVSPTYTPNKPTTEDDTFKTTLRTTKAVTRTIDEEEFPQHKLPYKKGDKPESKPNERKPHSDKPYDTDEDETFTETSERVIISTSRIVNENLIGDFEQPETPMRGVSSNRTTQKPDPKSPGEPGLEQPTGKRLQSHTRTQKHPINEDDIFKTTLRTTKTVTTRTLDEDEYPVAETPYPKVDKPFDTRKPFDTNDEETITEHIITTNTLNVTEKRIHEFEEPESPVRGISPMLSTNKPGQKSPEQGSKVPTVGRPESPTDKRPKSPSRTQKKPTNEDETFKTILKTTKTITTKTVDDQEYPEQTTPFRKGVKAEYKPKERKPGTDEEETFTEHVTTSSTRKITEKSIEKFEEPKSPIRGVSPSTSKKPEQNEPTAGKPKSFTRGVSPTQTTMEPTGERPKSPTRNISPTRKIPTEIKPTRGSPKYPTIIDKADNKPYSNKPSDTQEEEETSTETSQHVITSTTRIVTEKLTQDSERPKSPNRGISLIRSEKNPGDKQQEEPDFKKPIAKRQKSSNKKVSTSQRLITMEQQAVEMDKRPITPKEPKDVQKSPTGSSSPKGSKSGPNSTTVDDETFKKSLRTTKTVTDKTTKKPKDRKPGLTTDTDDEETTTDTEEFVIETCEKHYVTDTKYTSEEEYQKIIKSEEKKPLGGESTSQKADKKPDTSKPFTSTFVETTETIENQTYPEALDPLPLTNKKLLGDIPEPWLPSQAPKTTTTTTNINEQFITTERVYPETPDGAFVSKTNEPSTPTYRKKGTGRSDTFEERCRQILGMETYGTTTGTFKKQPSSEIEDTKLVENVKQKPEEPAIFQVKIEDCDEDDEPLSVNSVKKNLHEQIYTTEQRFNEPLREEPKEPKADKNPEENLKPATKQSVTKNKYPEDDEHDIVHTITKTTVHKKMPKTEDGTERESSEPETAEEHCLVVNKDTKKSEVKTTKKSTTTSSTRSVSPIKITSPRSVSPTKSTTSPRNVSPVKESPKRKPSKDLTEPKTKPDTNTTTTIKDRLRSATRKSKSPDKQDKVDGSDSSPERSPTRYTERRRSSNISVTTEIIIEHTDSDTSNRKEKSPVPKKPKDSVYRDIIDSTVLPEKLTRRMPVTERKESAPVHRVTNRDKDSKMARSTSENLIKMKKPEPQSLSPKSTPKTSDHRRPNKCFATKTINLSATDRLMNSEDMENVIIDIQHAKSSREPSPDKIVPTPVPAHFDTGKPRYPDVVQEPEDDQPRRKPQVKNIPIFEEEHNSYVGCHITEVNVEKSQRTTHDSLVDYEVEAPPSLDYPSLDKSTYEEGLLTVHEKVTKSKTSKRDGVHDEFIRNERMYTTVKLAPTAPQKSPELVRTVSRHISRQSENDDEPQQQPDFNNEVNKDYPLTTRNKDFVECLVNTKKTTKEFKVSHHHHQHEQHDRQQQPKPTEKTIEKTTEKYHVPKMHNDDYDDDELVPHTATHTTIIEERRQKDILSRPSVFDSRNKKPITSATAATTTTPKTPLKCNKSPVKDSEKLRPDNKSRTKPTAAVTTTITTKSATTTATPEHNKPKQQSPQRKTSDIDYELRDVSNANVNGSGGVETGVRNIISKQTKVYTSDITNSGSSSNKTNDLKKLTTTTGNTKPEKHMPVRLIPAKNSDDYYLSADVERSFVDTLDETTKTTTTNIDIDTQVVNGRKIPLTTPHTKQPTLSTAHSSTSSSPTDQSQKPHQTKEHVVKLTNDRNSLKSSNTVTSTTATSIRAYETLEGPDDIDEYVLEPTIKKNSSPASTPKNPKMSTTTDSVAARRSLFESNQATPGKRTPTDSPVGARRPSYMDHTKSSLEHIRRDSMEINKTNLSRKPTHPEEEVGSIDRNSTVKFDVPQAKRGSTPRATSVTEDINVEEINDLVELERLVETVQSYEIRRRIRAQIRLIKKNQRNEMITSTSEVTTKATKTSKVDDEETDHVTSSTTSMKTKPESKPLTDTGAKEVGSTKVSSSKKEYIFDEPYMPTTRRSPRSNHYIQEEEMKPVSKPTRSPSPKSSKDTSKSVSPQLEPESQTEEVTAYGSRTTKKHYYYKDEQEQQQMEEMRHKTPSPSRKTPSLSSSPERGNTSPESRSRSPPTKAPLRTRVTSNRSPDRKSSTTSTTSMRKTSASYEQQSSTTKPTTKRVSTTTTEKPITEDKTPVWADRKNILKAPSSTTTTPRKTSNTSSLDSSRSGYTKTTKSSTSSQKMTSNQTSSFVDDDCITSSYGIGPTDENGLPLFGIRALKKKKSSIPKPSETTEVTGYVVEESYYSDNKTKPTVERKEFIYSTSPEQLEKLKEQVDVNTNRKALKDVEVKETRQTAIISKGTPALRSSPEDDFLDSTSKYVRRGSVKEMSEKFIHRESSSSLPDRSKNYPKAGLILRTNSRKNSRDAENESENFESYKSTRVQQQQQTVKTMHADSDDGDYEVEEGGSLHSGRFITESESECDSVKTQREFKKVTSSTSAASTSTRSFLNSQGEEKVITNVSDCLERMRNADNVVEEGDTAEDQEARALLNKFLGASIIMKGVESALPASSAANRQSSRIVTTMTTTSSSLSDDDDDHNDGDNNAKHEIKATRITKTINSGNSSTPVTYTTCDIEEIWDEDILKELLEQARTYEERRKIRSRLRELMADREETKKSPKGEEKPAAAAATKATANVPAEEESSASEYEEIIEEVTDYSEAESEVEDKTTSNKLGKVVVSEKAQATKEQVSESAVTTTKTEEKSIVVANKSEISSTLTEQISASKTDNVSETVEEVVEESFATNNDNTDSSVKGESPQPMVHDKHNKTPQIMPHHGNSPSSSQSTNSQKLKTAQTSSHNHNHSGSSSMHGPKTSNNTPTTTQNPIVTVQTAGRADSTSINNKSNQNSNNSSSSIANNKNNYSNSSLGGSSVAVGSSDSPRQVDRLSVPQKEDSGTESGEDLRLIAAGLRDQLQIESDSNIIEDVTGALSRLENSLKEGKDISVDSEKRKALLALVARLRTGLTSPEKLAEIAVVMSELDGNEAGLYGETSSPEADAHRSNRSRFSKRRNRVNRHTVGVSREELADARRYMEDMILMGNISQSTTPEANIMQNNAPPQWHSLEKNASTGTILTQSSTPVLQRPKEDSSKTTYTNHLTLNNAKRRPHSGEYSVSFENPTVYTSADESMDPPSTIQHGSPTEDNSKFSRFTNKKHLMKRANTIDLSKTHKYNSEFDTDSDAEEKGPHLGLKRAVQVSVKKRVQNVVPPFEPKTENDRKFLAFINKQSDKPGLGWTNSRSVSNWTNKFGSIKSTFEGGIAGKPPQAPHHGPPRSHQSSKLFSPPTTHNSAQAPPSNYISNQQIALKLQQEAERQAEERRKKLERERLEYERRERDKLERQRQQRERQERERLEREHFERQRREQDEIAAAQHAAILRDQEKMTAAQHAAMLREEQEQQILAARQAAMLREQQEQQLNAQQAAANMQNVPKPITVNEFKHAPQSVFRPIDNVDAPPKPIYKPIPQLPRNSSNWQTLNGSSARGSGNNLTTTSPGHYGNTRPDNSFITSPTNSSRSPISLPWASKPTVDNSSFKSKTNRFEERSKYDNIDATGAYLQRYNSLRSSNVNSHQMPEEFRKRPSLPNTTDPYSVRQLPTQPDPLTYLPPPQNISFTYSNLQPKATFQSYPCLPLTVEYNNNNSDYSRIREDSLTDPHSVPLVLTSSNPSYVPAPQAVPLQIQQSQLSSRVPKQFDLISPVDSAHTSPSNYTLPQTDYTDDDLDSDNNLLEYHAVSRVMSKPQSQTAVTVGRRTGHVSDDELYGKNSKAAKNLLSTMKSLGNSNGIAKSKAPVTKRSEEITSPRPCLTPDGRSYQAPIVEPLFPEISNFEANRKPLYEDKLKKQQTTKISPSYAPSAPRKQMGMYKSMENLKNYNNNYMATTIKQASPKPYVSETQNSYMVTYPVDDTTDDEDFSRQSQKPMVPPKSLDLRRPRNVSENSNGSSNTTSISYSQNFPSPNTSWTSNPIVVDECSNYSGSSMPSLYQNPNKHVPSQEPSYQAHNSQVATSYTSDNKIPNYNSPPLEYLKKAAQYESSAPRTMATMPQSPQQVAMPTLDYIKTAEQYEAPAPRTMPSMPSLQQAPLPALDYMKTAQYKTHAPRSVPQSTPQPLSRSMASIPHSSQQTTVPKYEVPPSMPMPQSPQQPAKPTNGAQAPTQLPTNHTQPKSMPITKSSYEAKSQKQLQQHQQQQQITQKQTTSKSSFQVPQIPQQPAPERMQKPLTQKQTKSVTKTTTSTAQEKRSLVSMRKSISEDHHSARAEQNIINPQHSNISQEMLMRLDQQRERISSESRRKSLGNTIDYQEYKSSAPENTPDIVKSSLPKDEYQPILKKFGPPQRHHYTPNSYQSPGANSTNTSSATVVATSSQATNIKGKNVHSTSNQTVLKMAQQITNNVRPNVVEVASSPQPDDDYIPRNIVFNNVHAFTTMSRRQEEESSFAATQNHHAAVRPNKLSKSDSWNQIIMMQNQPSPTSNASKFNQSPTNELRRTKSGHTLALPKMYEASITKTDINEKQKTVAAYFSRQKSPNEQETVMEKQSTKRSVINRTKTSEKVSAASRKSLGSILPIALNGLQRSATMPHIANINLLDESNVEDAFEQLIMGS